MRDRIDATILKSSASVQEVIDFALKVDAGGFRALVTHPFFYLYMQGLNLRMKKVGVVDFPYGVSLINIKVKQALLCKEIGLDEIDYVVNIAAFRSFPGYARQEALSITSAFPGTVKAIVEVPLLTEDELSRLVEELRGSGVKFLKTSTGLYRPVTPEDVKKLRKISKGDFLIKASGGIRDLETAKKLIEAGADVLGTSTPFNF